MGDIPYSEIRVSRSDLEFNKFIATSDDKVAIRTLVGNALVPQSYDYISLGYTGSDLTTVIFKSGGVSGTTVATLTLAYSGSNLISVTKV
jgi:hypothetical protein